MMSLTAPSLLYLTTTRKTRAVFLISNDASMTPSHQGKQEDAETPPGGEGGGTDSFSEEKGISWN